MDWKAKYFNLIKKVQDIDSDLGIYPAAIISQNEEISYKERDGFKNGWNSAIMNYGEKLTELGFDAEKDVDNNEQLLLASGFVNLTKDGTLNINLNDTWYWATSDCEEIPKDKIEEVADLFRDYGWCGILYWVYLKRDKEKTAFKDNNRFIEFVEKEEQLLKDIPESNTRATKDYSYTLGK